MTEASTMTTRPTLTDEQFREARRQIVARLRWSASSARDNAQDQVAHHAKNPQNIFNPDLLMILIHRAREHAVAANQVEMMEREGFDWSGDA